MGEHPEMGPCEKRKVVYLVLTTGARRVTIDRDKALHLFGSVHWLCNFGQWTFLSDGLLEGCHSRVSCLLVNSWEDQYKVLVLFILPLFSSLDSNRHLPPPSQVLTLQPVGLDEFEPSESPCEKRIDCIYHELELPSEEAIVAG